MSWATGRLPSSTSRVSRSTCSARRRTTTVSVAATATATAGTCGRTEGGASLCSPDSGSYRRRRRLGRSTRPVAETSGRRPVAVAVVTGAACATGTAFEAVSDTSSANDPSANRRSRTVGAWTSDPAADEPCRSRCCGGRRPSSTSTERRLAAPRSRDRTAIAVLGPLSGRRSPSHREVAAASAVARRDYSGGGSYGTRNRRGAGRGGAGAGSGGAAGSRAVTARGSAAGPLGEARRTGTPSYGMPSNEMIDWLSPRSPHASVTRLHTRSR